MGYFPEKLANMGAPAIQCAFAFVQKIMALIYGGDAGNCSGLVIENFVGDVRRYAKAGHPGYTGAPQIVKTPVRYT